MFKGLVYANWWFVELVKTNQQEIYSNETFTILTHSSRIKRNHDKTCRQNLSGEFQYSKYGKDVSRLTRPTFTSLLSTSLEIIGIKISDVSANMRKVYLQWYYKYCGIIFICGNQCSWIIKIVLVRLNVILWLTGLLHHITSIKFIGRTSVGKGNPRNVRILIPNQQY